MISKFDEIIEKLNQINPVKYSKDRNFIDGSVSKLSPIFLEVSYLLNSFINF